MICSKKRSRLEIVLSSTKHKKLRFCLIDETPLPYALCALGLIGPTPLSIHHTLDNCLAKLSADTTEDSAHDETYPRSLHGEKGIWWKMSVVRNALNTGPAYLKDLKKEFSFGGCMDLHDTTKSFLIDGHLNASYWKQGPGRHTSQHCQSAEGKDTEDSWRHFMAVHHGRIYSVVLPRNGILLNNLWLDEAGCPDIRKGFLKRILKVYQVLPKPIH